MNEQEQTDCSGDALVQPDIQQDSTLGDVPAPGTEQTGIPLQESAQEDPGAASCDGTVGAVPCETDSQPSSQVSEETVVKPVDNAEGATKANPEDRSDSPLPLDNDSTNTLSDAIGRLEDLLLSVQSLAERMSAIESAFPILRKDVLSLSKAVSGLYTTTTDRMHAKIEKYDRGLEKTIAKPYLLSIAKIGDALRSSIKLAEGSPEKALSLLQSLRDDVRVPLWNAGLRVIEVEPGVTQFNPRLHDGIDVVLTSDKTQDGIIESVVEAGYVFAPESDEASSRPRVFRAAIVRVFKFDKTLDTVTEGTVDSID